MLRETAQQLLQLLSGWDRRLRLQQSVVWVPRGLIGGLSVAILLAIVSRLRPLLLQQQLITVGLIAGGAGIVVALAVIWLARRDALHMARRFDRIFDLKERVSTALEMATGRARSPNPEITERQLKDALTRAKSVNPAAYLPLRLIPRDLALAAALIGALALLIMLDNPQSVALAQQQEIQSVVQNQVEDLQELRDLIAQNDELDDQTREDLLQALDQALEELSQEDLSQEEALATLNDLAQDLQQAAGEPQIDQTQQQAFQQAMQEAASQLQAQAPDLANALDQGSAQDAADALQELGDQVASMDATQQQDLSEALQQAAEALSQIDPSLSQSLQQAAEALQQGDAQAAQEALDEASQQMSELDQGGQPGQMMPSQQNDTGGQSPAQSQQQVVSQAVQQAQQSAQQVAEAGAEPEQGQQSGQQAAGQGQPNNEAVPIGQNNGQGEGGQEGQPGASDQSQPGEGGQSQPGQDGQSTGQQATSGEQAEQGAAGAGAGDSDSNGETQSGFAATGEQIEQGNNPDGQGLTEADNLGQSQTIGGEGGPDVQLTGPRNPNGQVVQEGVYTQSPDGQAIIDYSQVFSNYANAANAALERDYIPLSLRDVVHDYFSSLEP